jgi:multiple sugar transport system permease protein
MTTNVTEGQIPSPGRQLNTSNAFWRSEGIKQFAMYAALIVLALIFLFPFYILVRNGLMSESEIKSGAWLWFSPSPHTENLKTLFNDKTAPMASGLMNSAIIAVIQLFGQLAIASMAGYGLARIPYRHSNKVFFLILIALMIPSAVTFLPTYVIVSMLGMVNTMQGIILPGLFNVFATFVFRQFFLDFPKDLEDVGRVDGLDYWGVFRHIGLPSSRGVFVALGVIVFISSWNSFLWPLVIAHDSSKWTVQIVLSTFLTAQVVRLGPLFMGAAVGIAPLVVLFFIFQRYIVQGVKYSGIKG